MKLEDGKGEIDLKGEVRDMNRGGMQSKQCNP